MTAETSQTSVTETAAGDAQRLDAVLMTVTWPQEYLDKLKDAFAPATVVHVDSGDGAAIADALTYVDAAVLASDLDERYLDAPNLRWVHCDHAGLNKSALPGVFEKDLAVTGSAGRSAPALAQHAFFFALALTYDAHGLHDAQRSHGWRVLPGYDDRRALWGKTLGVIGLGNTGVEVAALARAFGMRVLAYRRSAGESPVPVDRLYSREAGDSIDALLAESDVVVLATKLTDETHHLIGERELRLMKKSALLVNMARGGVVDEQALVAALTAGEIAGAGLDVFEQEPLPPSAPIWDAPNVMITPHATPAVPDKLDRSLRVIAENVRRFRAGEPLLNRLVPSDVYSHARPATPTAGDR